MLSRILFKILIFFTFLQKTKLFNYLIDFFMQYDNLFFIKNKFENYSIFIFFVLLFKILGKIMLYDNILEGIFIERPNRFIAKCLVNNKEITAHVKNTGRCKELLIKGNKVFLQYFNNSNRKTNYDLIAVQKNNRLINMDSIAPNKVVLETLKNNINILNIKEKITFIKSEYKYKNSRFDIYAETEKQKIFIEIKGVTLEENDIVMFPDAPTERGIKHINELIDAKNNGYLTYIIFLIQMNNVKYFTPNIKTHKAFADALINAKNNNVNILAYDCNVTENSITLNSEVKVIL